jgi:hypothetical protein
VPFGLRFRFPPFEGRLEGSESLYVENLVGYDCAWPTLRIPLKWNT